MSAFETAEGDFCSAPGGAGESSRLEASGLGEGSAAGEGEGSAAGAAARPGYGEMLAPFAGAPSPSPATTAAWSFAHWCTSPANFFATWTRMMLNLERIFPSSTHRYLRSPRYSTCAWRNASSAASPRPGAASRSPSASDAFSSRARRGDPPDEWAGGGGPAAGAGGVASREASGSARPGSFLGAAPAMKIAGGDAGASGSVHGGLGAEGSRSMGPEVYRESIASTDESAASTASPARAVREAISCAVRGVTPETAAGDRPADAEGEERAGGGGDGEAAPRLPRLAEPHAPAASAVFESAAFESAAAAFAPRSSNGGGGTPASGDRVCRATNGGDGGRTSGAGGGSSVSSSAATSSPRVPYPE